ncbi:MAG: HEPN domain protein [Candidatus Scalindua rubra]|uniref:HEPN domain protein n=1 Tax=Candidatus Scalindua rubra TaxID=1872076 RepID=A0A1E3XF20_9BACT|nr:MAG: HEPN domain protein [Candidatus Scalindua rubra]
MADPKIVNKWIKKADEDFNFADSNLKEESSFYAQICFHFHQAAEKYLKAFIVAFDLEFEKIHNLISLLEICSEKDKSLLSLSDDCEYLNTAYIDTRYPVHWPTHYTKEDALKAKKSAENISSTIKRFLSENNMQNHV